MKTILALSLTLAVLTVAHAQNSGSLDEVLRKRDAVLTQILESTRNQYKQGTGTDDQVTDATIRLYAFRRDSAKTPPERIQWQERIVAIEKENLASTTQRVKLGSATQLDEMLTEERVLAAEQKLLELRLAK